jgi:hypothetical protein
MSDNGKGSVRRPEDSDKVSEGWDRIDWKKKESNAERISKASEDFYFDILRHLND